MLTSFDRVVLAFLYGAEPRALWLPIMLVLSGVGSGYSLVVWVPLVWRLGSKRLAAEFFATMMSIAIVVWLLKMTIARVRPWMALPSLPALGPSPPHDFSCPSGHAAGAFAVFAFAALHIRRPALSALIGLFATLIALSRVYLGVHYPSDIVAGAIVGGTMSATITYILRRRRDASGEAASTASKRQ